MAGGIKGQAADIYDQREDNVGEDRHLHEGDVGIADDRQPAAYLAEEETAGDPGRESNNDLA